MRSILGIERPPLSSGCPRHGLTQAPAADEPGDKPARFRTPSAKLPLQSTVDMRPHRVGDFRDRLQVDRQGSLFAIAPSDSVRVSVMYACATHEVGSGENHLIECCLQSMNGVLRARAVDEPSLRLFVRVEDADGAGQVVLGSLLHGCQEEPAPAGSVTVSGCGQQALAIDIAAGFQTRAHGAHRPPCDFSIP